MRIVVEATAAVRQGAGVGRFARGLLAGLAAVDAHNDYTLLTIGSARRRVDEAALPVRHRWLRLPVSERAATVVWHRLSLAPGPTVLTPRARLYFTPDFVLPPLGRVPGVLTVHDLSFLVHPECAESGLRRYLERAVPRSIARAAAIVAVSATTAQSLTTLLGVAPERITIVPNAVEARLGREMMRPVDGSGMAREGSGGSLAMRLQSRFGLAPGYFLTVGTLEPRKNLVRLLEAYAALRRRRPLWGAMGPAASMWPPLVIVGRAGWLYEPIFRAAARAGLREAVRFLTRADDADLRLLYRGAGAFVFPSLYEGFGIPPLEAMANGIPVTASTAGALAEVLGDAALAFDPLDCAAMTTALERIMLDDALRATLITRGNARVAAYSWERSARAALALFERLAA